MILFGAWVIRATMKGQTLDASGNFVLFSNMTAEVEGLITGDTSKLKALDAQSAGAGVAVPDSLNTGEQDGATSVGSTNLLGNMRTLGAAANGYVMGATGPTKYDCSGLVWRALQKTYPATWGTIPRFTTANFKRSKGFQYVTQVPTGAQGDIVLWRTHIGVMSGDDMYYSAMSPRSGIGESKVSATLKHEPSPQFFRPTS